MTLARLRCVNPGQSEVWYDSGPSKVCCCDSGPSKVCWYDSGQSKVCWYDSGPSKVCWDDSDPYLLSASHSWFKSWVCFRCSFQLCVCGQIWLCVCTPLHLHVGADLTVFASLFVCRGRSDCVFASLFTCVWGQIWLCICTSLHLCVGADIASLFTCVCGQSWLCVWASLTCVCGQIWLSELLFTSVCVCGAGGDLTVYLHLSSPVCVGRYDCVSHLSSPACGGRSDCVWTSLFFCVWGQSWLCLSLSLVVFLILFSPVCVCVHGQSWRRQWDRSSTQTATCWQWSRTRCWCRPTTAATWPGALLTSASGLGPTSQRRSVMLFCFSWLFSFLPVLCCPDITILADWALKKPSYYGYCKQKSTRKGEDGESGGWGWGTES